MFIALFIHPKADISHFIKQTKFIELLTNHDNILNIYYESTKHFLDFMNLFNTYELPFNKIYSDNLSLLPPFLFGVINANPTVYCIYNYIETHLY